MEALAACRHEVWSLDDGGLRCAACGGRPFADDFRPQVEADAEVGMSGKTLEKATPLRRSGWGPWGRPWT